MKRWIVAALMLASGAVLAEPAEVWECKEYNAGWDNILVVAAVDKTRELGIIAVAGIAYGSVFTMAGFDRRWHFDRQADGMYKYAFTIEPNGYARYFDFEGAKKNERRTSKYVMECRQQTRETGSEDMWNLWAE